jgi:hypothetical protein
MNNPRTNRVKDRDQIVFLVGDKILLRLRQQARFPDNKLNLHLYLSGIFMHLELTRRLG